MLMKILVIVGLLIFIDLVRRAARGMCNSIWPDMVAELRRDHPELKTQGDMADWLVDNGYGTYGDAYNMLPDKHFK